jgi:hypothetical protein
MRRALVATLAATAMTVATALLGPAAATAAPSNGSGVVDEVMLVDARLYFDGELIVLTGPELSFEEGCAGNFELTPFTAVSAPSGVGRVSGTYTDRVWVFDPGGFDDPFAWLGAVCAAAGSGGPTPQPVASGEGVLTYAGWYDAETEERVDGRSRVTGVLSTPDGGRVHLLAKGEWGTFDADDIRLRP